MIRLCILQAGEHDPRMKRKVPAYSDLFNSMFAPFPQVELGFVQVRLGEFPESLDDWDAFLITGSAAGVYDEFDWLDPLRALIRDIYEAGKPLIGICFGHQLIADTLGGKAEKSDKGWGIGIRKAELQSPPDCIAGVSGGFNLHYVHQDQVTEPPDGATVFAGNDFCPVAAYNVGDRILSFQGHPEFGSDVLDAIMDFREELMGEGTVADARKTLDDRSDSGAVAASIVRFIEEAGAGSLSSVA